MSAVESIAWLPASVCCEVARAVDGVLSSWAATWGLPAPSPTCCEPIAAGAEALDDFVDLLAPAPAELTRSLSQMLFKFEMSGSAVMAAVVGRVAGDLTRQLADTFAAAPSDTAKHGPPGHRGVRVLVGLLGQRCGFVLTNAQLRACGRLAMPVLHPLQSLNLERALAHVAVPLVAELGRADINVDDLMQLAPGDVILLRETLDVPLRVVAPGSALQLSAHLGAASNPPQRAMRWLAS